MLLRLFLRDFRLDLLTCVLAKGAGWSLAMLVFRRETMVNPLTCGLAKVVCLGLSWRVLAMLLSFFVRQVKSLDDSLNRIKEQGSKKYILPPSSSVSSLSGTKPICISRIGVVKKCFG
ncbi:hypothetical protein Hanom_Chr03g00201641 [Helianthus anomalus]